VLRRDADPQKGAVARLLDAIIARARRLGRIGRRPEAAIDATGLESRHASRSYVARAGYERFYRLRWPKLTAVCDTASHLFAAAVVTVGPGQDSPQFGEAMTAAAGRVRWHRALGDAGYDGEHNHRLCREALGIPETAVALNRRNMGRRWPLTPFRREMKRLPLRELLGQRWQVESAFSQMKRVLGSASRARRWDAQVRECCLRLLTHDLMPLAT
jgi:hypothetical protein